MHGHALFTMSYLLVAHYHTSGLVSEFLDTLCLCVPCMATLLTMPHLLVAHYHTSGLVSEVLVCPPLPTPQKEGREISDVSPPVWNLMVVSLIALWYIATFGISPLLFFCLVLLLLSAFGPFSYRIQNTEYYLSFPKPPFSERLALLCGSCLF